MSGVRSFCLTGVSPYSPKAQPLDLCLTPSPHLAVCVACKAPNGTPPQGLHAWPMLHSAGRPHTLRQLRSR